MKSSIKYAILLCGLALLSISLIRCSSGGDPVAGGTGTGNPGGSVVVSMRADTGNAATSLAKSLLGPNPGSDKAPSPPVFAGQGYQIQDSGGMLMMIDTAYVNVQRIHFMLDSSADPSLLLKNFAGILSQDSESIILDKPFVFELVTGASYPSVCSLRIPEAKYSGIKLEPHADDGAPVGPFSDSFSVTLVGEYIYQDTLHSFRISYRMDSPLIFRSDSGNANVSRDSTIHFHIALDIRTWFVGIDLKSCLDNNALPRQPNGDLILMPPLAADPCMGVLDIIKGNMMSHAILKVY
jgi:hypothetical protein